jgi:hypothetical protein
MYCTKTFDLFRSLEHSFIDSFIDSLYLYSKILFFSLNWMDGSYIMNEYTAFLLRTIRRLQNWKIQELDYRWLHPTQLFIFMGLIKKETFSNSPFHKRVTKNRKRKHTNSFIIIIKLTFNYWTRHMRSLFYVHIFIYRTLRWKTFFIFRRDGPLISCRYVFSPSFFLPFCFEDWFYLTIYKVLDMLWLNIILFWWWIHWSATLYHSSRYFSM